MFLQQLINGLVTGSVYALFALGFTLIFGVHHILNLAHGAIFMWGAFVGLYCVTLLICRSGSCLSSRPWCPAC